MSASTVRVRRRSPTRARFPRIPVGDRPLPPTHKDRFALWGKAWGPAAIWAAVLFLLSEIRGVPMWVGFSSNDKLVHGVLYSVMGLLLGWGWHASGRRHNHLIVLLFGLIYAAVDEFHQIFVPYRIPSFADWVADLVGLVVGYSLAVIVGLLFMKKDRPTIPSE